MGAHPGHHFGEEQSDDELPLLLGEVGKVDHRGPGLPFGGGEERSHVQGRTLQPRGEGRGRHQPVEAHRQFGALLGREESVEFEDAQLAHRWVLHLGDEALQIEGATLPPRSLDDGGQQDVLRAGDGIGVDAGEDEERGHEALDLVAKALGVRIPVEVGHLQRADYVQWDAGGGAGSVDGVGGPGTQGAHALGAQVPRLQTRPPGIRGLGGELFRGQALALRFGGVHPGQEVLRPEGREVEQQVAHVPLGIDDEGRDTGEKGLLEGDHAETGLAGTGHAHDDPMSSEVMSLVENRITGAVTGSRIDAPSQEERSSRHVRHRSSPVGDAGGL